MRTIFKILTIAALVTTSVITLTSSITKKYSRDGGYKDKVEELYDQAAQKLNDTSAIKNLLEKESATWRSGDVKAHANCWHIQPYSRILFSSADGNCYDVPPETIINPPAGMMGNGGFAVLNNYKFSIHKNNAWVSHDEISTASDGTKTYSYEIRMLEKIKGQWKLVGQSIHAYKPK